MLSDSEDPRDVDAKIRARPPECEPDLLEKIENVFGLERVLHTDPTGQAPEIRRLQPFPNRQKLGRAAMIEHAHLSPARRRNSCRLYPCVDRGQRIRLFKKARATTAFEVIVIALALTAISAQLLHSILNSGFGGDLNESSRVHDAQSHLLHAGDATARRGTNVHRLRLRSDPGRRERECAP